MPRELGRGDIVRDAGRLRALLAAGGSTTHTHSDYVRIATADTITAVHTFNPPTATPFIILGVNAASQLITGLNADLLDGVHLSAIQSEIDTDIATHAALPNAHHNQSHVLATTSALGPDHTVSGLTARQFLVATGATTALFRIIEDADIPSSIARDSELHSAVTLSATLDSNLLSLSTQELGLDTQAANLVFAGPSSGAAAAPSFRSAVVADLPVGSAQYQFLMTGATPFAPVYTDISTLAGAGMTATAGVLNIVTSDTSMTINSNSILVRLATVSGLAVSSGLMLDDAIAGAGLTISGKVMAVGVSGLGLSVTADAVVLTSSPGGAADAHILATDASGFTQVVKLTTSSIEANADLTLAPTDNVIIAADVDLYLANGNGQIVWKNAAGTAAGGIIGYSADNDMGIQNSVAGGDVNITVTDSDGVASPYVTFTEYGTTNDIQVRASSQLYLTSASEGISLIPYAGQSVNVSLSTTGDFIVNTDDLVVDTSTGNVSMAGQLTLSGGSSSTGLKLGADVSFYRSAVNVSILSHTNSGTEGALIFASAAAGAQLFVKDSVTAAAALVDYGAYLNDSAGNQEHAANIRMQWTDYTNGSEDSVIYLQTMNAGTRATRATIGQGVQVGAPTGGDKGVGTLNAQAVYDDNTLLTDYVFEPDYALLPIDQMASFYREHLHLPTIPGRDEWEKDGRFPLGKIVTHLWETVEVQARYITELHERLEAIDA